MAVTGLLEALDYALDESLIAQEPLGDRDGARLLVMRDGIELEHRRVTDLPALLPPSLFVLNDTRVIKARLRGHKPSGGKAELLLLSRVGDEIGAVERWRALGKANKRLEAGARISVADGVVTASVLERHEGGELIVELQTRAGVSEALIEVGEVPLPPYIRRAPSEQDQDRYQTVFAARDGAVAAPTAGLHLSEALLAKLAAQGHQVTHVTLHVGPGTFAPVKADRIEDHVMHAERYVVPPSAAEAIAVAKKEGRPVVAVGTTVVRTLEAVAAEHGRVVSAEGSTRLFILPGYEFRVVDTLFTNFHLPRSTLLALVMAFGGVEEVRAAYRAAVVNEYRFFSYGDAMLVGAKRS